MIIDKDLFPTNAIFTESSNQKDVFMANINGVTLYQYENSLDSPFTPKAYTSLGSLMQILSRGLMLNVEYLKFTEVWKVPWQGKNTSS